MEIGTNEQLVVGLVIAPAVLFLALSFLWILGWSGREKIVANLTSALFLGMTVAVATLGWRMAAHGLPSVSVGLKDWFAIGEYGFPLRLTVDWLSLPMVGLTVVLVGLVGRFSVRYLHRDPGHLRFFLLIQLYAFGSLLLFTAGSIDLLIAGWELVGITSVLLIGFFSYRRDPVVNAVRVFATYRIADICILVAVFLAHHWYGSGLWSALLTGDWPNQQAGVSGPGLNVIGVLLVLAACGKSSQGPFFGWLPRAMEGPTPSSAIFYGAISVHAGAYLVLRSEPLFEVAPVARYLLMGIGICTAVMATLIHRTCTDVKTGLSYAVMTQLAVIFTEVSLGWTMVAIIHIAGHVALRTTQFLRAPSMLHEYRKLHAAAGGQISETGEHYEALVPHKLQLWLYGHGLERGRYDAVVDRFVILPITRLSAFLNRMEPTWLGGSRQVTRAANHEGAAAAESIQAEQTSDAHV